MSKYNKTILTNAGLDLAAKASSGKTKFTITRAATSIEKLADKSISELQQLTTLPSLMQYGEINNVADSAQDKSIVIGTELVFNNKDLTTGYNVNTIGLFAKEEGTNKEFLYALTTAVEPETMPDFKDKVLFKFNITMFVVVGQTDSVTVNVTQNGVVTQEQLAKAVQALPQKQDIININNAVDKINNTINTLGKVKKVQGKEPDAEGNVDITFGKIIKGWDMSNNTYDPSQTKNNDSISNIWPVDQMVIAQVVARLFSSEKSLKSEIAKKDNTADVNDKLRNKINIADLIGYISDHNGNHLAETTGDANAIGEPGIYFTKGGIKNLPLTNWGILQVIGITTTDSDSAHRKIQIYYPDGLNIMPYYRNVTNTTISAWHQLASTDDITNLVNRINTLGKVQKVNNQWPGLDGNVNINTADNITILPNNSSFNDVIKPGFYRGNNLKDGPYANVNDVFAVYGQKYAGSAITQVVYRAIHFQNTSRNYTRIYTRMGYFDETLNVLWGDWNSNVANIHINNTDPDNNGNVNINTLDNPTMLAYGSSLNNVIKPGFYRANACKDGPITDSIYNDVFCVIGVYKPGTVLTQFLPIAYYSTPDYFNNYTDLYLRTAYLDNNLIAHWGAFRKIPTTYA